MEQLLMERMTWEQVRDALASGYTRAIVVVGAMEQHGPHLPIATDTLLGYAVAERLARRLGNTLVAPAITVGLSGDLSLPGSGQMSMPGTITLASETLQDVIVQFCRSLAYHGFTDILVLPSHGGNYRPIAEVYPRLQTEVSGARVLAPTPNLDEMVRRHQEFYSRHGLDPKRVGFHAGQGETSMMLVDHPELVDMSKAVEGFTGDTSVRWRSKVPPPMNSMSPTGILGDARGSSAEIGQLLFDEQVSELEQLVRAEGGQEPTSPTVEGGTRK